MDSDPDAHIPDADADADAESGDAPRARHECPVHHEASHEPPFYVVGHHREVVDVLRQPSVWRNGDGPGVFYQEAGVLGSADGPDHHRHRRALRPAFLPSVVARLDGRVAAICDDLWNPAFGVDGEDDFVRRFAFPFPARVVADLLGVDPGDRDRFGEWSAAIVRSLGTGDLDAYNEATESIWSYVDALVDERETTLDVDDDVRDDVVTILTRSLRAGELDRMEVRRLAHQLLVAGHETTTSLISSMLIRLLERPILRDELRAAPNRLDIAVEEMLRFDSPVQGLFRTSADPEVLAGVDIPARTKLQVHYGSANRDPQVWPDPDRIRFDRDPAAVGRHVGFGWGVHYCIGAPLARLQARHALRRIVERFETVEATAPPTRTNGLVVQGISALPIRWTVRDE